MFCRDRISQSLTNNVNVYNVRNVVETVHGGRVTSESWSIYRYADDVYTLSNRKRRTWTSMD
jgi:peptidoglycan hydrolase-like protein with peptidoglycan-binding domain